MKNKIILLLFMVVGFLSNAQEFDFDCETEPVVVNEFTFYGQIILAEASDLTSSVTIDDNGNNSGTITLELPDDIDIVSNSLKQSGVQHNYKWTLNAFSPGDRVITIDVEALDGFNYSQKSIWIKFHSLNDKFSITLPPGEVEVTVLINDDIQDNIFLVEYKGGNIPLTVPLPSGLEVVEAISPTQWFHVIGNTKLRYKISERFIGDTSVGITFRTDAGFNFAQEDFTIDDLVSIFKGKIGIPEVDPGDLGNWFFYDADGTPQAVPDTDVRVFSKWKLNDDVIDGEDFKLTEDNLTHTFGDSNLHVIEDTFLVAAQTNSSDIAFPGIEGGDYDGYALIHNGNSADYFAKWTKGSKSYKVLVVTHDDFVYSGSYFIGGAFIDIR